MKRLSLLFALVLVLVLPFFVTAPSAQAQDFIPLQVKIPVPSCSSINPEEGAIVQCDGNLITAVADFPALTIALFEFLIILMAVFLVGAIAIGGLMYLASAGIPAKIDFAKNMIKNAALSLLVLLFSVIIIQQVNPVLLDLSVRNVESIDAETLCIEITDEPACTEAEGCAWLGGSCVNDANIECSLIAGENAPDICNSYNKCEWLERAKKCVEPRNELTGNCEALGTLDDQTLLQAVSTCWNSTGCVFDSPTCSVKDPEIVLDLGFNPCTLATTPGSCVANANCKWYILGTCIDEPDAFNKTCSTYTQESHCPNVACYWDDDRKICIDAKGPKASCESSEECGRKKYCARDTDTCVPRKGGNAVCKASQSVELFEGDNVCLSGECLGATGECSF